MRFLCPCTDQQCTHGFLTLPQFRYVLRNDLEMRYWTRRSLIPGMNFTCDGTITNVTVGGHGVLQPGRRPNQRIRLRIWKEGATDPGVYHRSEKTIFLEPSTCRSDEQNKRRFYVCRLMIGRQVSVEPGDILGIELPPRNVTDFELHSVSAPGMTNYIFRGTNLPLMVDLYDRMNKTEVDLQPLIMLGITWSSMDSGIHYLISSFLKSARIHNIYPTLVSASTSPAPSAGFEGEPTNYVIILIM